MTEKLIFNDEFDKLYNYDGELGVVYFKDKSKKFQSWIWFILFDKNCFITPQ